MNHRTSLLLLPFLAALVACSKQTPTPDSNGTQQSPVASPDRSGRGPGHGRRDRGDGPRGGRGFGRMFDVDRFLAHADQNKNGSVELSELPEKARARMADADANKDGALSREELEAHGKKMAEKRFAAADKNKDGSLTQDEVHERMWEHLKVADADGNNAITLGELTEAQKAGKLKPHGGKRGGRGPGGDPPTGSASPEEKGPDLDDPIKDATEDD
jgi:hypothetical protein